MGNFVFPTFMFNPSSLKVSLVGAAITGGAAISGDAQFADLSGGGRWVAEFGESALWEPALVKTWRALSAAADGGATPIIVPLGDRYGSPLSNMRYSGSTTLGRQLYDTSTTWTPEEITATLDSDHALRATQVAFTTAGGEDLIGGEHLSILNPTLGWRLHRLTRIVSQAAGAVVADIRPPLREAAAAGTYLNFENPCCLMRVEGDMDLVLDMLRFGRASARFVETFPPSS